MAVEMTDSHRRFLQILMSHGIMEGSEVRALHRHCCEAHKVYYAHDKLDEFISVINTQLHPLFMQIRKGMSEDDGRSHYALVNLAETEVTKMSTDYAENELELFRKTMDLIILSDNGLVSSTNVLNLVDQLQSKKLKKKEAEQVLQTFVQDKWLFEKEGEYTLSTRCIMEMDHYIRNAYQDVVGLCNICHSIVIQRQTCETCGIQMHFPCVAKYFRGQPEPHCPNCNGFWPHEIPDIGRSDSPQRSQQPSTSREPSTSQVERRGAIPTSSVRKSSRR